MKKTSLTLILLPLLLFSGFYAHADSPLTSTYFAENYAEDHKLVNYAAEQKSLDKKIAKFLLKKNKSLDLKLAVINAMGWNFNGTDNAEIFLGYLSKKYKTEILLDDPSTQLTGAELICLGYITAMSDYFHPQRALPALEKGLRKLPNSLAANMVTALVKAQIAMENDWCKVWKVVDAVVQNSSLEQDFKATAIETIMEYINLYQSEC